MRRAMGGLHFRRVEKNSTSTASVVPLDLRCVLIHRRFGGLCRTATEKLGMISHGSLEILLMNTMQQFLN